MARVRAMARVHEDEGDSEDDNDIVARGQQCRRRRVVGHPTRRTRVRVMVRVWRART